VAGAVPRERAMTRVCQTEILEAGGVPGPVAARAHRDLTRLHRVLGHTGALERAIRRDPLPVRRLLDVGCGHGGILVELQRRLGVDVIGADKRPPADAPVRVVRADAIREPLPTADVAYSLWLAHHFTEAEVASMICNVGRFCRRFLLVDLVRHPLPLALFRTFVAPFFSPVAVTDGIISIRRAYTPEEFADIARRTGVRFTQAVSPIYASQTLDISY
jgi:SAM-dependent methyltransferase